MSTVCALPTGTSKRPRSKGWLVTDDDSLSTWADMYDSDDEGHRPEPEPCNNAIVLSGPPGCGKTAAVAAVAKVRVNTHGFTLPGASMTVRM